jgi:nucleoside phosphorylase/CheY-like chemotaxis protein
MKILLIEDNSSKKDAIVTTISNTLINKSNDPIIAYATDLQQAIRHLNSQVFDLVIFDMYLPDSHLSNTERDCSQELICAFSDSKNYQSEAIALTKFEINEISDIHAFNLAGITLVNYNDLDDWKIALKQKINRASQKVTCDFLIFCALTKERIAFTETVCKLGERKNIYGMDCQEACIGNSVGFIIKPRSMGLVYMAIVASKAIELFQPKIVSMSGICAGIEGESNYLDLIVGKTCWEYQTGKWKDGEFKQEPYQVNMSRQLEVDLQQSTENIAILELIRKDLFCTELGSMAIKVAPISSGSAVIADKQLMERIGLQHRKMAGLEMEMYSLYEAAAQSLCNPWCFGAKAVVDMGDSSKGDSFHDIGCIVSARYITTILEEQLKKF